MIETTGHLEGRAWVCKETIHKHNQRMIDTRPAEVETRATVGQWEGDLINGAHETGNLVTLVERNTRFSLVGRTDSKEAEEVTQAICALFLPLPYGTDLAPAGHPYGDGQYRTPLWNAAPACRFCLHFHPQQATLPLNTHSEDNFPAGQRPVLHWPLAGGGQDT